MDQMCSQFIYLIRYFIFVGQKEKAAFWQTYAVYVGLWMAYMQKNTFKALQQ